MNRRIVSFRVVGVAQPKGSTRAFVPKGWTRPIITTANPKSKGWQQLVAEQAQTVAQDGLFVGPVLLSAVFCLPRPQSLPKRVLHHTKKPDLDKLVRSTKDALKGVLYHDDAQVVKLHAEKRYAAVAAAPCVHITVADALAVEPAQLPLRTTADVDSLFADLEVAHA
jgi:Holliday junction resolvase RusA-like endonuclease